MAFAKKIIPNYGMLSIDNLNCAHKKGHNLIICMDKFIAKKYNIEVGDFYNFADKIIDHHIRGEALKGLINSPTHKPIRNLQQIYAKNSNDGNIIWHKFLQKVTDNNPNNNTLTNFLSVNVKSLLFDDILPTMKIEVSKMKAKYSKEYSDAERLNFGL